jgi:uncharacterized protein YbjT (DUF2867 family)
MADGLATVFGGSGFIGRYLVQKLAQQGWRVRVAVRRPDQALFLKTCGSVGQVTPFIANIRDDRSVRAAVEGSDVVVNLVGILFQSGAQHFDTVQATGAGRVAAAAKAAGVKRLVHFSAIGADAQSASAYARSKAAGEAAVRQNFPGATILRPSIVFGPEDDFFNRFARLAQISPILPLIGGGATKFQPVYVVDVAAAAMRVVEDDATAGKTYELGGPRVYSFRELLEIMLHEIGRRRCLVGLPFGLATLQAAFLQLLPNPMLTVDQVRLLKRDNVVSNGVLTLKDLGVAATSLDVVLPTYLDRYRPRGHYSRA